MSWRTCSRKRCPSLPLLLVWAFLYVFLLAPGQASGMWPPGWTVSYTSRWKLERALAGSQPPLWHIVSQFLCLLSACPIRGRRRGLHLCRTHCLGVTAQRASHHLQGLGSCMPLTVLGKGVSSASGGRGAHWGNFQSLQVGTFTESCIWQAWVSLILTWSQGPPLSWAFSPVPAPGELHLMLQEAKAPVLSPEGLYPWVLVND